MSLKNNWKPTDTLRNTDVNDIANEVNKNTEHKETKINENDYTHGLKYNKEQNSLIIQTDSGDVSIGGSNDSSDIQFTPDDSGLISNNIQDAIKEVNNNINEHEKLDILSENGVHGIKYDELTQTLKYKKSDSDSWENIVTSSVTEESFNRHVEQKVIDEDGVHGIRYNQETRQLEVYNGEEWEDVGSFGGASFEPVKNLNIRAGDKKLVISWRDPVDNEFNTWKGTKLVYKIGSYPKNPNDGTLVVDNVVRDKYNMSGFELNGLTNDTEYYFMLFPYNHINRFDLNVENKIIGMPHPYKTVGLKIDLSVPDSLTGVHLHDSTNWEGNTQNWDDFFNVYPCLLKDGVEMEKLNENNYALNTSDDSVDLTGPEGDVMIAIPIKGVKLEKKTEGSKKYLYVEMTDDPNAENRGFRYYAHTKGREKQNTLYVGVYYSSTLDGKAISASGKRFERYTLMKWRQYCQAKGEGYNLISFYQFLLLQCMYLLKYRDRRFAANFIKFSTYATTGAADAAGMFYAGSASQPNKFLGIECVCEVPQHIDGAIIGSNGNVFTCQDNLISDESQYTDTKIRLTTAGNMKEPVGSTEGGFINALVGASTTTYFCDYGDCATTAGIKCWASGTGANDGIFYLDLSDTGTANYAGRLMYL